MGVFQKWSGRIPKGKCSKHSGRGEKNGEGEHAPWSPRQKVENSSTWSLETVLLHIYKFDNLMGG